MFQTKSLENGFVFHFSILSDGVVFWICFFKWFFPSLVCLVWFGLEGMRENLGKRVSFLGPIQAFDPGPVTEVMPLCPNFSSCGPDQTKWTAGENPGESGKEGEKQPESASSILED